MKTSNRNEILTLVRLKWPHTWDESSKDYPRLKNEWVASLPREFLLKHGYMDLNGNLTLQARFTLDEKIEASLIDWIDKNPGRI